MRLSDLADGEDKSVTATQGIADREILGLTSDSRRVEPGFLFAALPGSHHDGRTFIGEALSRGAAAVLAPPGTRPPEPALPMILDANPRRRFAQMAARFHPGQPPTVAAVTGTNGKTSVVAFLRRLWRRLGRSAASLGTLGLQAPGIDRPGGLTTPDPVDLHRTLSDLQGSGVECLALEASSHGLAQYRLDGVRVTAAAFTNLGRDHLDYHGTPEAYLAAKLRLFQDLVEPGGAAVVNADTPEGATVAAAAEDRGLRVFTYGFAGTDIQLTDVHPRPDGQALELTVAGRHHGVTLPLIGDFQVENALCALGLAVACGEDPDAAIAAIAELDGVPGRLQRVARRGDGAVAYVDYAHTPDALAAVLRALRPHTAGRLHVVFGCGGDRDRGKRPQMGRVAADLADVAIVTDDNPRTENPAAIRHEILAACPGARDIGDRAEAIANAVAGLAAGDLLVVAGKGHESGQIIGTAAVPFDDAAVVRAAFAEGTS